jgi:hypothetical protein
MWCMVHATRILVDDISGTGSFVSMQHPNTFPQSVTLGTQETVAVLLHVVDVAEMVFIQVQIHVSMFVDFLCSLAH